MIFDFAWGFFLVLSNVLKLVLLAEGKTLASNDGAACTGVLTFHPVTSGTSKSKIIKMKSNAEIAQCLFKKLIFCVLTIFLKVSDYDDSSDLCEPRS
ncbi:hypothetical protein AAKU61_000055 [Undibacterium sp. GrIS 1.2]|uniref:hypothetical protein n=1 Tax=Undibacterium sp. GrIS 1.2 TaxID=3143933 RepID=UPI003390D4AE